MNDAGLRLDKWLWQARFVKTRGMVKDLVRRRRIRVNDQLVAKVHRLIRPGDVLTLVTQREVFVLQVEKMGSRRGPASEAQTLYRRLNADF